MFAQCEDIMRLQTPWHAPIGQGAWHWNWKFGLLLSLACCRIAMNIIFSPAHCGIQSNEAADAEAARALDFPQDNIPIWHVDFLTAAKRLYWQEVKQEEERGTTPRSAVVGKARTPFHLDPDILGKESRLCAQARCDMCPLFGRIARALKIALKLLLQMAPSSTAGGSRTCPTSRTSHCGSFYL
ncbi:hypothetical protein LSM04_000134 [Trypanosoma melophagium]|uniref:uncharacterized protein n=1 Tax=Trypanosoma melophagium TaxID=715481 RepID=UPI00351AA024|nr:hypothetical protein LSM04_000134 [Trypanosoma melophagium]